MAWFPGYGEFYQRALLQMGQSDSASWQNEREDEAPTHWLIALQGYPKDPFSDFYSWEILIYEATSHGSFHYEHPFYRSEVYTCIHKAYDMSRAFTEMARDDRIAGLQPEEQIS
ncbi:hypothetical protein [Peribacillus kribbensis]|uniref:hypothetical protein n=1 Tax=Peribacillus kribbensis TaxID=356658 RepID=UPI0003FC0417|nr:hypothetical protein [Peribacillus kribbensis]